VLEQVAHNGAPGLPAASGDPDLHVRHPFIRRPSRMARR
jgi:hypothetical protein